MNVYGGGCDRNDELEMENAVAIRKAGENNRRCEGERKEQ